MCIRDSLGSGERHISVKVKQHNVTMRAVGFGKGEWYEQLIALAGSIDIAYRPVINEFRGRRNVEMHLVDWRLSEQPALATSSG